MFVKCLYLVLQLFAGCSSSEHSKALKAEEQFDRERDRTVHRALKKFIKDMETKGYRAAGIGEGLDHSHGSEKEKQNYLAVTFDIERLPNIDFARRVEIEALQILQGYINAEDAIHDYVAEYPYPIKFLNIAFISKIRDENLCIVSNFEEEIYYYKDEPGKPLQGPPIEVHRESYAEAVRILVQQGVLE